MGETSQDCVDRGTHCRNINRPEFSGVGDTFGQIILGEQRTGGKECWINHRPGLAGLSSIAKPCAHQLSTSSAVSLDSLADLQNFGASRGRAGAIFGPCIHQLDVAGRFATTGQLAVEGLLSLTSLSRVILAMLRPDCAIDGKAITIRRMTARKLTTKDKTPEKATQRRIGATLRNVRERGVVISESRGGMLLWAVKSFVR